jgi:hypothetical protein
MFQLAQQSDVLQPAKALFDPLPPLLADGVAGVPGSARIDGTAAWSGHVLRHVRCHVHMTAFGYEIRRVKSLVTRHRDAAVAGDLLQHHQRGIALRPPVGFQNFGVYDQAVAILYLSGGIDGRPPSAYRASNNGDIEFRISSVIARTVRSG